jgi:hypothetical protein
MFSYVLLVLAQLLLPHAASYPHTPLSGWHVAVWDGSDKTLVTCEVPKVPLPQPIRPVDIKAAPSHGSRPAPLYESGFEPAVEATPTFLFARTGPQIVDAGQGPSSTLTVTAVPLYHALSPWLFTLAPPPRDLVTQLKVDSLPVLETFLFFPSPVDRAVGGYDYFAALC